MKSCASPPLTIWLGIIPRISFLFSSVYPFPQGEHPSYPSPAVLLAFTLVVGVASADLLSVRSPGKGRSSAVVVPRNSHSPRPCNNCPSRSGAASLVRATPSGHGCDADDGPGGQAGNAAGLDPAPAPLVNPAAGAQPVGRPQAGDRLPSYDEGQRRRRLPRCGRGIAAIVGGSRFGVLRCGVDGDDREPPRGTPSTAARPPATRRPTRPTSEASARGRRKQATDQH